MVIDGNLPLGVRLSKSDEASTALLNIDNYIEDIHVLGKELIDDISNSYNTGITLHIPRSIKIDEAIKLEFIMNNKNQMVVDKNIIVADEGSEATLIIDYKTDDTVNASHKGLTMVYAKENSVVNIIKIQRMNDISQNHDTNVALVEGKGRVNWISVELGSNVSSANYTTILYGEASEGNLSSIYLGDGARSMDIEYSMIHRGQRSLSNIDTKGVLMDQARKVFKGNLDFKKGAKRSKGNEEEYVILLDPRVKSDSIPGLFCEEDDVEGNHAASAGQIDEYKMFYLMSRGLSEKEAKKLIVEASFRPIIDNIPSENTRKEINEEIERRFRNALS